MSSLEVFTIISFFDRTAFKYRFLHKYWETLLVVFAISEGINFDPESKRVSGLENQP